MSALPIHALYPCVWPDGLWCGTPALVVRLVEHPDVPLPLDDELPDDLPPVQFWDRSSDEAVTLNALLTQRGEAGRFSVVGPSTLATVVAGYRERHVVISAREPGRHPIDLAVRALQDAGRYVQIETTGAVAVDVPGAWITLRMPPARLTTALAPGLLERVDEVLVTVRWRADLDRAEALLAARPQVVFLRPSAYAEAWVHRRAIEVAARHSGWRVRHGLRRV